MKKGKFEKKLLKADTEDLCNMLLRKLYKNPFSSNSSKNQLIYDQLPDAVREDILDSFYEQINGMICETRKSVLTGLGQCNGRLLVSNGNVLFCCCEGLATLISHNVAFIDDNRIRVPSTIGVGKEFEGGVYSVDSESMDFNCCPYCGAKIQRKMVIEKSGTE